MALLTSDNSALDHGGHEDEEEDRNQVEEDGGFVTGDLSHALQLSNFFGY